MNYNLYLDDLRTPPKKSPNDKGWVIARSFDEALQMIKEFGFPEFISFDHDLGLKNNGQEENAYDFVKKIIDMDMDHKIIPEHFDYQIHSANNIGAKNIFHLLENYLKFRKSNSKLKP